MMICVVLAALTLQADWTGWSALKPIGRIKSVFPMKFGTPRQGACVPDATATLQLTLDGMDARAALDGLDDYSHVWLLWAAHLNGHDAAQAKVQAPKLRGGKAGLFATRSPYRPNPIGLSLVRLEGIDGDSLRLAGVDLVDGTPVLDVKPYVPYCDAFPDARAGWVDELDENDSRNKNV